MKRVNKDRRFLVELLKYFGVDIGLSEHLTGSIDTSVSSEARDERLVMSLTAQLNTVQNAKEGELELSTQSVGRICADRRSQAVIRVLADCGPLSFESLATAVARRYHTVDDVNAIESDLRDENRAILQHKTLPELDNHQVIDTDGKIRLLICEDAADVLLAVSDIVSYLCLN